MHFLFVRPRVQAKLILSMHFFQRKLLGKNSKNNKSNYPLIQFFTKKKICVGSSYTLFLINDIKQNLFAVDTRLRSYHLASLF